jgi:hypothetical protein
MAWANFPQQQPAVELLQRSLERGGWAMLICLSVIAWGSWKLLFSCPPHWPGQRLEPMRNLARRIKNQTKLKAATLGTSSNSRLASTLALPGPEIR